MVRCYHSIDERYYNIARAVRRAGLVTLSCLSYQAQMQTHATSTDDPAVHLTAIIGTLLSDRPNAMDIEQGSALFG